MDCFQPQAILPAVKIENFYIIRFQVQDVLQAWDLLVARQLLASSKVVTLTPDNYRGGLTGGLRLRFQNRCLSCAEALFHFESGGDFGVAT